MKLCSLKQVKKTFSFTKPRIAVWCIVLLLCIGFSALVLSAPEKIQREYAKVECQEQNYAPYMLVPGSTLVQELKSQGQSTGEVSHLYLNVFRQEGSTGSLSVRIIREKNEELLAEIDCAFAEIPACADINVTAAEAFEISQMEESQREELTGMNPVLQDPVMLGDGWFLLKSGEYYRVEITNNSESHPVCLLGNPDVQSGKLTLDGEQIEGFLNLSWMRKSLYTPSRMLLLMVLLTDATVLLGLALVLFTDVKVHVLYLVLAIGFGVVTLFDLTPLYGFDMRFQFDSAYVLSNRLLGIETNVYTPSLSDPENTTLSYYRRICDDYSQYQFYHREEISANYTDMKAGLRSPFADPEKQELELVETALGFVESPLYLCLPQAVGFTVARLLGLGMYPMLQAGRLMSYVTFVLCMVLAIRAIPFGKRIMMVLGLMPAVLVQVISVSRDAMIIAMSFLLIALVLKIHYADKKPDWYHWLPVVALSVLLAPCKMVYLPVSCLCAMTAYRHYILPAGKRGKRFIVVAVSLLAAALGAFVVMNADMIKAILFEGSTSLYNTPAYSVRTMLEEPLHTLYVFGNTLRNQFGSFLINAVQLFDIDLGSSDGITIIVFFLLLLEACCADSGYKVHMAERNYMLLVAVGSFLLIVLAAFRWTPLEENVFIGLQGRYLIPILPLLLLAFHNSGISCVTQKAALITKSGCCIFPAISLMNMYLWSIQL